MKTTAPQIVSVDPADIKVFVHRERNREEFEAMRDSIKELGQKQPAQIRDISSWPRDQRQKPGGGLYKWGLLTGEGRLMACREIGRKLICEVKEVNDAEAVGLFLSENLNRDSIPWAQRARLVKRDVEAGMPIEEVAKRYFISQGHVRKFVRILNHTAKDIEAEVADLSMNDAEAITALPADHQSIIIQVANESGLKGELRTVIAKAKEVAGESGELSAPALKASLSRVDEDLRQVQKSLKVTRLHHSLSVQNLSTLLQDAKFRKALDSAGVNYQRFEKLVK